LFLYPIVTGAQSRLAVYKDRYRTPRQFLYYAVVFWSKDIAAFGVAFEFHKGTAKKNTNTIMSRNRGEML
jgi:hypothetical protein